MAVELATAYVSLVPSAKGVKRNIARELDIDQPAERAGRSAGGRISGALGKALKTGIIGAGVAAGAALSGALVKGWGRLQAIEDAEAKLDGLGHSSQTIATIMDNALGSVLGTAFGLGEAATVAASAVAAGIRPGEGLERVLSLVGDTATIAGASMGEMGAIFNKVAASNRVTMQEVNQLSTRGVPILQMLADQMGVTAEEASRMVSSGQVDFATFASAIEDNIAGAALRGGDTTRGAFANMGAAAGRFGAVLLGGVYPVAQQVFTGMIGLIDRATEAVGPWAEAFSSWVMGTVVPAARDLAGSIGDVAGQVQEFIQSAGFQQVKTETIERLGSIFGTVAEAGRELGPALGQIAGSLGRALASVGISTWQILLTTVDALARVAATVLVPAIQKLAGWMERNQGVVTTLVGAWAAYRVAVMGSRVVTAAMAAAMVAKRGVMVAITGATRAYAAAQWLLNKALIANPIGLIIAAVAALVAGIVLLWKNSETFRNIVTGALDAVAAAAKWLWEKAIKPAWAGIKLAFEAVAGVVSWWWENVTKRVFDAVVAAAKWVWDMIKRYFGFWRGVLENVVGWVSDARQWIVDRFTAIVDFVKGLPGRIRRAASGMWDGIKNAFRSALNWIIDKWNGLSFTLPEMNLGPLGKVGGWTLRPPRIPRLAQGGIVPATPGGRVVRVAEAGEAEAIIPLSKLDGVVGGASAGPDVLVLDIDLGEGIKRRIEVSLREHDRQITRRVMAGTGAVR